MKALEETSKCPHPDCNQPATLEDPTLQFFKAILDDMFKVYDVTKDYSPATPPNVPGLITEDLVLTVTLLTGQSVTVPFDQNMEVLDLKLRVQNKLKHDVNKQKLLYKEKKLKDHLKNGLRARLSDFGVQPNSTILLVVLLFAKPKNINDVVFDFNFGYPSHSLNFLDATCFMFNGSTYYCLCDYKIKSPCDAIRHSGDVMDDEHKKGHHTMNVSLKDLPPTVTYLFFTLSAYKSPIISRFPNTSLQFYEAANPSKDLCKTTFHHAGAFQAVIMCSLSRGKYGKWEIFESGKCSDGNEENYEPLITTIRSLIDQGF